MPASYPDTIVIGSGIAGLTAALYLAKGHRRVLVLEASHVVGGRTASWIEDGMPVESGLHKFLGIYRELPAVLRLAGIDVDQMLTWVDEAAIVVPGGASGRFGAAPYHRPLGTIGGLLGNNRLIPPVQKLRLAAMLAMGLRDYWQKPLELDRYNLADYAARFGVSRRVTCDVLLAATAGVFFMPVEEYSAYATFAPIAEGIKRGLTFRIGAFNGGMTEVMMRPLADAIERSGGEVRLSCPVSRILIEGDRACGVEVQGEVLEAASIVLATAIKPAQDLLRAAASDHPWLEKLLAIPTLSAVTVQLELDKPALPTDHTNFSPSMLSCYAEQSHTTFRDVPGRLSTILYPPHDFIGLSAEQLLPRVVANANSLGLELDGTVRRCRVVSHPQDFYALRPGVEALRPGAQTPIRGLVLAGDYTRQPFLASMEGAAISGRRAAQVLLNNTRD